MKFFNSAMMMVAACLTLGGCVLEQEGDDDFDDSALEVGFPAVAEEAFAANAINYTCAQTLSFRTSPNGAVLGKLGFHTKVWATSEYKTSSTGTLYVLVQPKNGAFSGQWGWVQRSWVDQNC